MHRLLALDWTKGVAPRFTQGIAWRADRHHPALTAAASPVNTRRARGAALSRRRSATLVSRALLSEGADIMLVRMLLPIAVTIDRLVAGVRLGRDGSHISGKIPVWLAPHALATDGSTLSVAGRAEADGVLAGVAG